mmetsp:Transcript_74814/g.209985  ORF Transcript_74814/g.209985 Transcript_74814/m.209985 type:complete len:200 (+) Transcript_74814:399-998(+)
MGFHRSATSSGLRDVKLRPAATYLAAAELLLGRMESCTGSSTKPGVPTTKREISGSNHRRPSTQRGSRNTRTGLRTFSAAATFERAGPSRSALRITLTFGCKARSSSWKACSGGLASSTRRTSSTSSMSVAQSSEATVANKSGQACCKYGITTVAFGKAAGKRSKRHCSWRKSGGSLNAALAQFGTEPGVLMHLPASSS